jgi:hypothetical protein
MDGFDAALRQLAEHGERLALLDAREAEHFAAVGERLTELGSLVTGLGSAVRDQAALLAAVEGLDEQVATLTTRLAAILGDGDGNGDDEVGCYRPSPAPRWWKLHGPARAKALGKLAGWVGEVYRPGYGQLASTLGPCWGEHPLCLYALDIASELWSVLYLQASRTPGVLSAQAEYQTRILPALAGQMLTETTRCGHAQHRPAANGAAGRRP